MAPARAFTCRCYVHVRFHFDNVVAQTHRNVAVHFRVIVGELVAFVRHGIGALAF